MFIKRKFNPNKQVYIWVSSR